MPNKIYKLKMYNSLNIFKQILSDKNVRTVNANKNTVLMFFFKGVNILISFMYVPLLINSLNSYRYGIWLTITSIIAWLNLLDIGLGNGLRNKLSESIAKNDTNESKHLISTAYASITILSILMVFLFFLFTRNLDWSLILNIPVTMKNEVTKLVNLVFILFSTQFLFSIINSILFAIQKPAYSSFIMTLSQILSFSIVAFYVLVLKISSLFTLGLIISISPIIVLIIFTLYIFTNKYKLLAPNFKYVKFKYLNSILELGLKFFILQIITVILFQTSNIIIAQNVGQEGVTEYNIAYKYIGLIFVVFSIIITPYWSAATEAYFKGDLEWIKQSVKKLNIILILFSFVGIGLLLLSSFVYKIWIGKSINADYITLGFALIYFILQMKYSIYGYILNGMGKIYIQLIITSIVAIFFIPITIYLARQFGLNGVFVSLIITALINAIWSSMQFKKIMKGEATGLWLK